MPKHTILYAEDDLDDLHVFMQAIERYPDIEVLHFFNGVELLQYTQDISSSHDLPCLVVLDLNMPGMDGKETLIQLKKNKMFARLPIVLFTTSSSLVDKAFALQWDVDFVTKPLIYSDLERLVDRLAAICYYNHSNSLVSKKNQ